MTTINGWLTSEQAAKRIGIITKNMLNFLGCERVTRQKVGARYLYNEADVTAVIKWRASNEAKRIRREKKAKGGKATAKKAPQTAKGKGITLQTEDQVAKAKARQAIMQRRLLLGIVHEEMTPYPVTAVGTPEQVAALKVKWA